MCRWTAFATLLLLTPQVRGQEKLYAPADVIALAHADVLTLPAPLRQTTRYLDLSNVPAKQRAAMAQVLSGWVNHLSTESDLVQPVSVAGGLLLRLNYEDYGWSTRTWEALANEDPYYHVRVVEKKIFVDGKAITLRKNKTALAPWLAESVVQKAALADLIKHTGSGSPVLRGDWFLWQTGAQTDRKTGYYDFLGVKNQKDFERLVGFSAKLLKDSRRVELLEAVAESGVAQQPRRIASFPTVGGLRLWKTFDNQVAEDKANPLRVLDRTEFTFLATEEFGPLPNGLWAFGLFSNKGERQDSAPDFVGYDSTSTSRDGKIHIGVSCVRCHYPNAGLNPVDTWARNLFRGPLVLQSPDPKKFRELRQQYLRDLEGPLDDDRRAFTRTLKQVSGLEPKEYAKAFTLQWAAYESGVTLERAARDVGVTPARLKAALLHQVKTTGSVDTVAAVYLREQPGVIPLRQWHETVPLLHLAVRGYTQP